MTDLPSDVDIHEEGPREGFQIEPGPISTADKIRLIEALSDTGLRHIQVCSFVNPRLVPGWADAEAVVAGFNARPGIEYTGLWFNANGLERALAFRTKLTIAGGIALTASEGFTRKNLNRSHAENVEAMRKQTALHLSHGVPVNRIGVMAAFGCNYQGDITPAQVIRTLEDGMAIASEAGAKITLFSDLSPGQPHRRHGGVRLQLPGRHHARAGDPHAGGRHGDRQRGRRQDHLVLRSESRSTASASWRRSAATTRATSRPRR